MPTSNPSIRPRELIVHCLIEKRGDQWQALSLEFGLAAQADSGLEARSKLEDMVKSYVHDALVGEDVAHADALMSRKASPAVYLRYYIALMRRWAFGWSRGRRDSIGAARETSAQADVMPMPLTPLGCAA